MLTGKDKETNRRIELFMVRVLGCLCGMAVVYKMACLVLDGNAYRIVYFVLYAAGLFFSVLLLLKTRGWSSGWVHAPGRQTVPRSSTPRQRRLLVK